jgi:site-specific DNA-methyltransferase (adenine-specific)
MYSSKTGEWATPQALFDKLNEEFGPFDLDPCATIENAKCKKFYTKEDNGLNKVWGINDRIFVNPPYGREIGLWVAKAYDASKHGASVVVMLIPARTDTKWWHLYVALGEVRFIRGRLKFNDGKNPAPFPSAIVIFRKKEA